MTKTQALLLWSAATDRTFVLTEVRGERVLVGKCIHCNTAMVVGTDGQRQSRATVEHIIPQTHGGTNDIANLAVACSGCNGTKGRHHDNRPWDDPGLQAVIATLVERRRERWREPIEGVTLPKLATETVDAEQTEPEPERKSGRKRHGKRRLATAER